MQISCPKCQYTIERIESVTREEILCPSCGSTFRRDPRATISWVPGNQREQAKVEIGETVLRYRVLERVGSGGMGVVYKAQDMRLNRHVALKFLPEEYAQNRQRLERFQREVRTTSALNHPHICTVHDVDEYAGQPFLVMEWIEEDPQRSSLGVSGSKATNEPRLFDAGSPTLAVGRPEGKWQCGRLASRGQLA